MESIIAWLSGVIISVIEKTGYVGIATLMALESVNIPIPSEVIMPFSGYLAFQGKLNLIWVALAGAFGNLIGSLISYYLGFFGGRALLARYGKFLLLNGDDVDLASRWFEKYGMMTIFVARLLPIVRTFISFPAGIARMNIWKFSAYTFFGSLMWSFVLAYYVGVIMGEKWENIGGYFRKFDWVIVLVLLAGGGFWVWRHVRGNRYE